MLTSVTFRNLFLWLSAAFKNSFTIAPAASGVWKWRTKQAFPRNSYKTNLLITQELRGKKN